MAELRPAFEHFIYPMSRRLQIGGYRRDRPPFSMQVDDSPSSLVGIGDLRIGWIAPPGHGWLWSVSQDSLDRMVAWPALKAQKTDGGNFMGSKVRVLSFQIDNQLAHLRWETAPGAQPFGDRALCERGGGIPSCSNRLA